MKRLIGAVVAVTLLGALFVTSFLGAFRQPEPHDVPIAVVGPDQVVARLEQQVAAQAPGAFDLIGYPDAAAARQALLDRKSTRLNSSHVKISYAVFCLKKKKNKNTRQQDTTQ